MNITRNLALLLVCLLLGSVGIMFAQTQPAPTAAPTKTSSEIQAPFDKDGKLWIITEDMERQFNFFPKYRNVIDARLFQLPDSSFVLELTQLLGSTPENTRIRLSLAELVDLRTAVSDALQRGQMSQPQNGFPQGSSSQGGFFGGGNFARPLDERNLNDWEKTSLVIGATTLGLSYGLLADGISLANGIANPRFIFPNTYITTIATPIAFGLGTYWAASQPWFTRLSSLMLLNGISSGFVHGLAGYFLIADQKQADGRALGISGILGSLIEPGFTLRLPETLNLNYGQTSLLTNMGSSTILTGALAAVALGAFNPDTQGNLSPNALRLTAAASLLGSAGGYFLGYRIGQSQNIAPGDAIVFENPAGFMSLIPLSIGLTSLQSGQPLPDFRLLSGLTVGAQALGYVLGNELIRDKDFTFDQGRQINQAVSLGATIGLIPLYAALKTDLIPYAPLLVAVGGAVGFTIAYLNTAKQAELFNKARRGSTGANSLPSEIVPDGGSTTNSWLESLAVRTARHTDVQFSPLGLFGLAHPALGLLGGTSPIITVRTQLGAIEREETEWQLSAIKTDILRLQDKQ